MRPFWLVAVAVVAAGFVPTAQAACAPQDCPAYASDVSRVVFENATAEANLAKGVVGPYVWCAKGAAVDPDYTQDVRRGMQHCTRRLADDAIGFLRASGRRASAIARDLGEDLRPPPLPGP